MRSPSPKHTFAKKLRSQLSPPEVRMWLRLRARMPGQPLFRRQHPIGPFIADFFCAAAKLVVEVDGHLHGYDEQVAYDAQRDDYLQHRGYRVIRIGASEIMADADAVADWVIAQATAGGQGR